MSIQGLIEFSARTIEFLEADRASFARVVGRVGDAPAVGRLGVGMITTASAAFDTYAYLLFGKSATSRDVSKRIRKLTRDRRFFGISKVTYPTSNFLFDVVRNGVVHQFYPKNADIYPLPTDVMLYNRNGRIVINSWAFYNDVLRGIKEVHQFWESSPYYVRKAQRRLDDRLLEDVKRLKRVNISLLEPWPPPPDPSGRFVTSSMS